MNIQKLCISSLSLVYLFASVMDTKNKCPLAEIHALGSDNYKFLSVILVSCHRHITGWVDFNLMHNILTIDK